MQLMVTQLAEFLETIPLKFKRSNSWTNQPSTDLFTFGNDHTFNLVLTHASRRKRVLRYTTILSSLQGLVMTLHYYSENVQTTLEGVQSLYNCRWNKHLLCHYSHFHHQTHCSCCSALCNRFSCIDHACIHMLWQIDQVNIVPSNHWGPVLYGNEVSLNK